MITMLFIMEDTVIKADYGADVWNVVLTDMHTGQTAIRAMSDMEFAAVMALAIGYGEAKGHNGLVSSELYRIAEPALVDVPKECRPIP